MIDVRRRSYKGNFPLTAQKRHWLEGSKIKTRNSKVQGFPKGVEFTDLPTFRPIWGYFRNSTFTIRVCCRAVRRESVLTFSDHIFSVAHYHVVVRREVARLAEDVIIISTRIHGGVGRVSYIVQESGNPRHRARRKYNGRRQHRPILLPVNPCGAP